VQRVVIVTLVLAGCGAGVAGFVLARGRSTGPVAYRTAAVERGDVTATVSATGTLNAVSTVQVGTQVSGQIAELNADYNSHVERGQLIARLDSTLLWLGVRQAQAAVRQARADSAQQQFAVDQAESLHVAGLMAEGEYVGARTAYETAQAGLASAEVGLEKALESLRYVYIYSPIAGTVVQRNVDVGQTVQASFSAPQLFLIAADLREMQILASVDESDIGAIRVGQAVRFTVPAYPERTFTGRVSQVRLQSSSTENVVTYTIVVAVSNRDLALLPGMTATVTFETAKATNVLKVADAALRFRAPAALAAAWNASAGGTVAVAAPASGGATGLTRLWVLGADGRPAPLLVRAGISDGLSTEISGDGLRAGMRVIAGQSSGGAAAPTGETNPFQSTPQRSGPPPMPGGV
jgi:HlyD family secretion protein